MGEAFITRRGVGGIVEERSAPAISTNGIDRTMGETEDVLVKTEYTCIDELTAWSPDGWDDVSDFVAYVRLPGGVALVNELNKEYTLTYHHTLSTPSMTFTVTFYFALLDSSNGANYKRVCLHMKSDVADILLYPAWGFAFYD